jgi:uncharacterized membrane protein
MSSTGILLVIAIVCGIASLVLHVVMVVQGFKRSAGWGVVALLVPLGSLAFALARSGRRALAVVFLLTFLGAAVCGGVASYLTARAVAEAAAAGAQGLKEFDQQVQDLENLDDIKL